MLMFLLNVLGYAFKSNASENIIYCEYNYVNDLITLKTNEKKMTFFMNCR